jgi:Tol biopolymer transport system component/DNA-binding winged helix-turn-helix (wHTH) protein
MQEPVAPLHARRFYAFGPFRLDPANRLLLRDGQPLPLTGKVSDLLLYFVENSDRLLTKDEILKSVWPDSFVEEGNLARHVSTLRKTLGEGPRDHAYVVTVSGRGYRFVAHVSTVTDHDSWKPASLYAVETSSGPTEILGPRERTVEARSGPWARVDRLTLSVLGVAIAALVFAHWVRPRPTAASLANPLSLEWRTNTGDVYAPAVSRDGAYLAYCWVTPDGKQGLRVRQAVGGNTIDVVPPAPVSYWAVRFSAGGDFIYYVIADLASNSLGTLFRVPTLGGRSERVLEHVNGGIALSPDGQSLAFTRINAAPGSVAIMTVGTAGGPARTVMTLDMPAIVQSLDWSPDGRRLLYALKRREYAGDRWHVAEIPVSGGPPAVIVPPRSTRIIAAVWLPERRGLLLNAVDPESALPQIWRVSYPDGAERRLTDDLHNYKDLTITADGSRVVTQSLGHLVQLWIAPGAHPGQPKQIATGTARGAFDALAWTPDVRLLYKWGERGFYDIWRMAADGSAQRQLTARAGEISDTSIAPDGRFVFFISTRGGSSQIWRMKPDGDDLRQLTHLKSLPLGPVASPDGRWVYFSTDERGFPTLWRMTLDGQSIAEVSDQPIELFNLSPDGRWLAYSYRDSHRGGLRVAVVPIDATDPRHTFDIEPTFALRWTPDGQGVAFTHHNGNVWVQPVSGGSPYAVTRQHPGLKAVAFAWSPDARYLAYTLMAAPVDAIAFRLQ